MDFNSIRADLEVITYKRKPNAGETIANPLMRLDALCDEQELPAQLHHYLSKRSYVKAIAWLDNPDLPHEV